MESQDRESLLGIFLTEARDTLRTLEDGLARLPGADGMTAGSLEPLRVVTHRLKGAAALHGFPGLAGLAGAAEQMLEGALGPGDAQRRAGDFLTDLVSILKRALDEIDATAEEGAEAIAAFLAGHPVPSPPAPPETRRPSLTARGGSDIPAYFAPEATEHLEVMTRSLLALEQAGQSEDEFGTLLRAVHTLKGATYIVGLIPAGDLAHQIEDLLMEVRDERLPFGSPVIEAVLAGIDALRVLLGVAGGPALDPTAALERAVTCLNTLMPADHPAAEVPLPGKSPPPPGITALSASALRPEAVPTRPGARAPVRPGIRIDVERLDLLMNLVGELVIARSRLDRRLLQLEHVGEVLSVTRSRIAKAVRELEGKSSSARGHLEMPAPVDTPGPITELFGALEFDRYDDYDLLARSVGELSADLAEAQTELASLTRTISDDSAQIRRLTGSLRDQIIRSRLVPIERLFGRFAKHVWEAAQAAGKKVVVEVSGESVTADNTVLEQVADPLLHLVQNAITHGIETEDERRARRKAPHGTVHLSAYHRGGFVYVEVRDDGRGIDAEFLKERAVRQGLLPPEVARLLSEPEALDLIFLPGLSTAARVTPVAGRGVGMDVVRTNVARLNGEISVETEVGVGTRFTIKVPATLLVSEALNVRVGQETLAIPLNAVRKVLAIGPEQIQSTGRGERLLVDDRLLDLIRLDRVLALAPSVPTGQIPVVVLRAGGKPVAVTVGELLGKGEIVIKKLGGFLDGVGPFAGATITGEGRVILVLDPNRLAEIGEEGAVAPGAAIERPREGLALAPPAHLVETVHRILLVDDSISVRKFVGQMLEKAGFSVVTASDGAEALQRLEETSVHVVITDLEMPRLNGFELIHALGQRPTTRDIPVVVLTTRAGAKHLDLARWLGVKHYVSKPVDEHAFVRLIASLTPAVANPA